ncbi:hypothetical protein THRCLA_08214 [Thraustotheca clavata]|uniref:PHD-type domain-containing protein n=1 Tax=Thraustotheca clavata TaxID=74557 RepID=A0A1V9Z898_9STRA|nr:hypothetical protein THRCLA_08214 [Thraustotheca clavata]
MSKESVEGTFKRWHCVGEPGSEYDRLVDLMAIGRTYDESYMSSQGVENETESESEQKSIESIRRYKCEMLGKATWPIEDEKNEDVMMEERINDLALKVAPAIESLWKDAQIQLQMEFTRSFEQWKTLASDIKVNLEELIDSNGFIFTDDRILHHCLELASTIQVWNPTEQLTPCPTMLEETTRIVCRDIVSQRNSHFAALQLASAQLLSTPCASPEAQPHSVIDSLSYEDKYKKYEKDEDMVDPTWNLRCFLCNLEMDDADMLICSMPKCGKAMHPFCVGIEQKPKKKYKCPCCAGQPEIVVCAALHCKRKSSRRYCIVHSCRFEGCEFRLRGRGYCRRHDSTHKRNLIKK